MRHTKNISLATGLFLSLISGTAWAADYPAPKDGTWVAPEFHFHTGQTLPNLRLHYVTVGDATGEPVLILHGTAGTAAGMLNPGFADILFRPGQPLDAHKYFIILTDALGAGESAKPSDGLRAKFPEYDYDDMVLAQFRLLNEGLGIKHLRAVLGNSMGGMHAWLWAVTYPTFADVVVPMASQPGEMAGRNWMMRRMIIDMIRGDDEWDHGNYAIQPKSLKTINVFFGIATNGGTLALQSQASTHAAADRLVDQRLAAPFTADANDFLYQWNASRDFNASPKLEDIRATVLAINSADDERNPPETGLLANAIKRVPHGRVFLIPASEQTSGHSTTGFAKFWASELAETLRSAPVVGHE